MQIIKLKGSDDIMFQGDMEQWVRFANTIKLRIAIRESNTTEIAAITQKVLVLLLMTF
jgi:hypothetical protein